METYTKEESKKLIKYYSSIIIGQQVSTSLSELYKVTSIEFEFVNQNEGLIYCIANYNFDIIKRNLINYINDFNLIHPSEVLKANSL